MKSTSFVIAVGLAASWSVAASAQIVTTQPPMLQQTSQGVVITYYADRGNRGLKNLPKDDKVYAHTGVITSTSKNDGDWKYAPSWGDNSPKYELTRTAENTYTLNIGQIDTYYGVPAGETVKKLAFVFRNTTSNRQGKTVSNGDIMVTVWPAGFYSMMTSDLNGSALLSDESVTFTAACTEASDITIKVDGPATAQLAAAKGVTELEGKYSFKAAGEYTVTATYVHNGLTDTETIKVSRLNSGEEVPYPGGTPVMGAVAQPDGSTLFCLAAPEKDDVILQGSWNDYAIVQSSVMNLQTIDGIRYFWTRIEGLNDGKDYIYFYNVDGKQVGDPYARLVLDPYNDRYIPSSVFPDMPAFPSQHVSGTPVAVYNSNRDVYDWQVKDFKGVDQSALVIYELLIRDFTGTEGQSRGNGTVAGVIEKLDYLKSLGVNAVELLPIMEFNGNNSWGYNTNFYFAPDKAYGTPDDYRRLIDECHARGMAVILDIVFNQSDGLHPWYMMYAPSVNPFYNAGAPHAYSVLNDWKQEYPLVQQQWKDALKYWLTAYKVDGFRFDLVKGLGNNDSYDATYNPSTNTFTGVTDAKTNAYNASRVARMKELHNAMREVNPDAYFINENLAGAREENEMAADGETNWANINHASCQFAMGNSSESALSRFYAPSDGRTWGSTVSYAESHDEERMAYKQNQWGAEGVKGNTAMSMRRLGSVAAQMLMTPGAHMIWQFQEFGADQTTKNSSGGNNTDPKKVIWKYLDDADRYGLYDNYCRLNAIRKGDAEMFLQDTKTSVALNTWNVGRTISLTRGDKAIYVVVNPEVSKEATVTVSGVDLSDASKYGLICRSYNTAPQATAEGVKLAPGAFAVYGTLNLAGIDDVVITDGPDSALNIYGTEGAIVVEGNPTNVEVYTVAGTRVPMTGLDAGIYIVRADNRVAKVRVY